MLKLNMEFTDKSPRQEWLETLPERYPQKVLLDGAYIRADIVEQMIDAAITEYQAHEAVTKLLNSQKRRKRPREDIYVGWITKNDQR